MSKTLNPEATIPVKEEEDHTKEPVRSLEADPVVDPSEDQNEERKRGPDSRFQPAALFDNPHWGIDDNILATGAPSHTPLPSFPSQPALGNDEQVMRVSPMSESGDLALGAHATPSNPQSQASLQRVSTRQRLMDVKEWALSGLMELDGWTLTGLSSIGDRGDEGTC